MQQLEQNIQYSIDEGSIKLKCIDWLDDEQWIDFIEQFSQKPIIDIVSLEEGADRHQLTFRFKNTLFILNIEHLCEAAWIESLEPEKQEKLLDMYSVISKNAV